MASSVSSGPNPDLAVLGRFLLNAAAWSAGGHVLIRRGSYKRSQQWKVNVRRGGEEIVTHSNVSIAEALEKALHELMPGSR